MRRSMGGATKKTGSEGCWGSRVSGGAWGVAVHGSGEEVGGRRCQIVQATKNAGALVHLGAHRNTMRRHAGGKGAGTKAPADEDDTITILPWVVLYT
jgi:hypothetical protein